MKRKQLSEYKKKYHNYRHHAWAGLGFLSVVLAIRLLFQESTELLTPFIVILGLYIVIALIFTYKYRAGLQAESTVIASDASVKLEKEKIRADVEKARLKTEKKKAKAEAKHTKKHNKNHDEKNL